MKAAAVFLLVATLLAACAAAGVETTATTSPRECIRVTGGDDHVDTGTVSGDAMSLSGEIFLCADDVVVASENDLNHVMAAAQLAAAMRGPLLLPDARLSAEIGRLRPRTLHVLGDLEINVPPGVEVERYGVVEAVEAAARVLGTEERIPTSHTLDAVAIVAIVDAIDTGARVVGPDTEPAAAVPPSIDPAGLVEGLAARDTEELLWLVDAADPVTLLFASAAVHAVGATVIAIDGSDLLGNQTLSSALRGRNPGSIRFVGGLPDAGEWEVNALVRGEQLPGGGFHILSEESPRRYVAFYGHPVTGALGALGQQDGPPSTLERMRPLLDAYTGDGHQVIPTFEMIATVAAASAGPDGNYSTEWDIETFRPWVDFAEANDMYVVLDLQSGRSDFLTQSKLYEELLLLPHVGIALDPEWRLAPDQVHLEQIGRVEASEVNQVIHWLADLVRDNGLPQKMLIVHQFRMSMIQNRDQLESRPEIQVIIQMDGEGSERLKDNTWNTITRGTEDAHWAWGWKNFFVRDEGGPPSPESTMSKVPTPVFVSYQ
jgi:hypothetical protein